MELADFHYWHWFENFVGTFEKVLRSPNLKFEYKFCIYNVRRFKWHLSRLNRFDG